MTTMVCFEAAGEDYCLPVQVTRAVRTAETVIALPDPVPDVVGVIAGDPPLTVISALQSKGTQILVVDTGDKTFGLLVDKVTGLLRVDDDLIRPAPSGQQSPLISGILDADGHPVLVADPIALAGRL
jgi:chemotaxis signal transduction protein